MGASHECRDFWQLTPERIAKENGDIAALAILKNHQKCPRQQPKSLIELAFNTLANNPGINADRLPQALKTPLLCARAVSMHPELFSDEQLRSMPCVDQALITVLDLRKRFVKQVTALRELCEDITGKKMKAASLSEMLRTAHALWPVLLDAIRLSIEMGISAQCCNLFGESPEVIAAANNDLEALQIIRKL